VSRLLLGSFAGKGRSEIVKRQQKIFLWTGGRPETAKGSQEKADALPYLPAPAALHRTALIEYSWGETRFEILATACSVRITAWGDEQMTWLHCKARPIAEIKSGEAVGLITVIFPAQYVTAIQPGPPFQQATQGEPSGDLGVFPPNQPPPEDALALWEIERVIVELMEPADDSFRWV
jgi:hypothetical protein